MLRQDSGLLRGASLPKGLAVWHRIMLTPIWCAIWLMSAAYTGCVAESKDAAKRDVAGPYQSWDEVITRWVGGQVSDLYVELGPPNLHPHQREDGTIEMTWDFAIDRMPGQADAFNLLPLYAGNVNCQIHFFADLTGKVLKGERVGCE